MLEGDEILKRIFISHSTEDMREAKILTDFLMKIGIDGEKIMCSSLSFSQIPINKNIYDYLKEILKEENFVILLLSDNYYKSATCLNEMGAAWIREMPTIPILLSKFKIENMKGVVDQSKIVIPLDDRESILKAHLCEMKKLIEEFFDIQVKSKTWEYALDCFVKEVKNTEVQNKTDYINMLKVESYCIGEFHHEGCRVMHGESDDKKTVGQIDFSKTKAYLCSILYKIRRNDWTNLWKENKNLHFCIECNKHAICTIEVHFESNSKTFAVQLPDDKTELYIPLKQFEDYEDCWKNVKELCFVFSRANVKKDLRVIIEGIEII